MKKVILSGVLSLAISAPLHAETLLCLIEPDDVVEVGSQVIGVLEEVGVDRGDSVRKGQVVARLVSRVEQQALEVARFRARKMAELGSASAAKDYAQRERERAEMLVKKNFVSKQYLDQIGTDAAVAAQKMAQAEENRRQAELEVKLAQAQLDLRTIRSPVTGVVMDRYMSAGHRVEQQPILKIAKVDVLRVEVIVPSRLFKQIKPGMSASVTPELPGASTYTARVSVVDQVIDAASNSFRVRLELPNPDQALPAGARCKADISPGNGAHQPESTPPAAKPAMPETHQELSAPPPPTRKKAASAAKSSSRVAVPEKAPGSRHEAVVAEARKEAAREAGRKPVATQAKAAALKTAAQEKPASSAAKAQSSDQAPNTMAVAPSAPVMVENKPEQPETKTQQPAATVAEQKVPVAVADAGQSEMVSQALPETTPQPATVENKQEIAPLAQPKPALPSVTEEKAATVMAAASQAEPAPAAAPSTHENTAVAAESGAKTEVPHRPGLMVADAEGAYYSQPELVGLPPTAAGQVRAPSTAMNQPVEVNQTQKVDYEADVWQAVQAWARAWSARDANAYRAAYAEGFRNGNGENLEAWMKKRQEKMQLAKFIEVQVADPLITMQGEGHARAEFQQTYRSDKFNGQTHKILLLFKNMDRWLIVRED